MGSLLSGFVTWLGLSIPAIVWKVLSAMGIGYVAYTGVDFLVTAAETFLYAQLGQMSGDVLSILNLAGMDVGIRMILAAATTAISIKTSMGVFSGYRASRA